MKLIQCKGLLETFRLIKKGVVLKKLFADTCVLVCLSCYGNVYTLIQRNHFLLNINIIQEGFTRKAIFMLIVPVCWPVE